MVLAGDATGVDDGDGNGCCVGTNESAIKAGVKKLLSDGEEVFGAGVGVGVGKPVCVVVGVGVQVLVKEFVGAGLLLTVIDGVGVLDGQILISISPF